MILFNLVEYPVILANLAALGDICLSKCDCGAKLLNGRTFESRSGEPFFPFILIYFSFQLQSSVFTIPAISHLVITLNVFLVP